MSSFLYKYVVVKSFIKGKKAFLYFSRFILRLYRLLPVLLRLAAISFRFFNLFYRSCYSLINFRFWLLIIHHFLQLYQAIFMLRITMEFLFINPHTSNKVIKSIFYLSEPYFKTVQSFFPTGFIGGILAIQSIEILNFFIRKLCRILNTYSNYGSTDFKEVDLILKAVFDEKFVFI